MAPIAASPAIAIEAVDPSFTTGGTCPATKKCRFSDAAFARYTVPATSYTMGRIARPTSGGSTAKGVITISASNPYFTVVGEAAYPWQGEVVHKVGRTSGWTSGTVTQTCKDTDVGTTTGGTTDMWLFCQDFYSTYTEGGDSGSPVFFWNGGGVSLVGNHWGGNAGYGVFSSMGNIEQELGALTAF